MKVTHYFIYITLFISCSDLSLPEGTPSCIEQKIKEIKTEAKRNPPASVWQYTFEGKLVYYIPSHCCDIASELYDSNCNLLCRPDGGFSGKGDGKCPDFISTRTGEKLIWQDER